MALRNHLPLVAVLPLALAACSNRTSEPEPGSSASKAPAPTTAAVPKNDPAKPDLALRAPVFSVGDFAPLQLKAPAKLVRGTYGSGEVHRWSEVAIADRDTYLKAFTPQRVTSKVFFTKPPAMVDGKPTVEVPLDASEKAEIFIVPGATAERVRTLKLADLQLALSDPGGKTINAEDERVHVVDFEGHADHELPLLGSSFQHVRLDAPSPGVHKLAFRQLNGVDAVGAIVTQPVGTELEVTTDRPAVVVGEPITIRAKLTPGANQTAGAATMTASIVAPGNRSAGKVELHDDGVAPDVTAGDHEYAATFVPESDDLAEMGGWILVVEANGQTGEGAPVRRHVSTGFAVSHPIARFTGAAVESMGAADGVPVVTLTVTIDAAIASRFRVKGVLVGADGKPLAETSTAADLAKGSNRVALHVPQKYLSGSPGPYRLEGLELVSVDVEAPVARVSDAFHYATRIAK